MRLSGGAAFLGLAGAASANHTTSGPVSGAPVPNDPNQFTYATMGEGNNPTATLYGTSSARTRRISSSTTSKT
ncbi:hypothetical protein [Haladaptatus halobius]|uniref:hypothetical protein n=1 Tax=Haladaptatus halobius TaxID=2884875 RepID=UPI001D0A8B7C|nr:hypothetical protein [Haladaptatus halobius]